MDGHDNDWRIPDDDLDPASGIKALVVGSLLGALVWAVIGFAIWWVFCK